MPLALATGMGSTFDCADHSNSVCVFVRSTISWPVIVGLAVAVVIYNNSSCFQSCSELARVFLRPALDHNFLFRIELDRVPSLCMHDAEEAVFPPAERKVSHGRGHSNIDSDIPRRCFITEAPRRRATRRKERCLVPKRAAGHYVHGVVHVAGMNQAQYRTKD